MFDIFNIMFVFNDMESAMSFREKMHRVAFIAILLAFGWYFLTFPWSDAGGPAALWIAGGMLIPLTLGIIVAMSVATAIIAIRNRREVDIAEDERDRMIHWRGTHLAYYPMVTGTWACIGLLFTGVEPVILLNLLLAMVVVSELLRIGSQIWFYRHH